jgi:hypothetical protein
MEFSKLARDHTQLNCSKREFGLQGLGEDEEYRYGV